MDLSASIIKNLTAPGMYSDGKGLNLRITGTGSKSWVLRCTIDGKRTNLGLGSFPEVGLAEARKSAKAKFAAIARGENPRSARQVPTVIGTDSHTFRYASDLLIRARREGLADDGKQWYSSISRYAYPAIGEIPVSEINTADVQAVLQPIWLSRTPTARRVRGQIEAAIDYAIAMGWHSSPNPATKAITKILPRQQHRPAHHAALPYAEVPAAVKAVQETVSRSIEKLATEFLILCASRRSEVSGARWDEIDWKTTTWIIPAERMKSRRLHRVPLSDRAMDILRSAWLLTGSKEGLIFLSAKRRKFHNRVMLYVLEKAGLEGVTIHGFRSAFKDWCIEQTSFPWAVSELALAHIIGTSTEVAYARTDLLEQRRVLMQQWADYVSG